MDTKAGKIAEGGFKSFLMLYKDLSNIEVKNLQQKAERTPELFLLHLLKEAGKYHSVLFLDAYEHLLSHNDKIKTNLDFSSEKEFGEEDMKLVYFVEKLVNYLQQHGWHIVSGSRRMRDEEDEAKAILRTYSLAGMFSSTNKDSFKLHEEIQDLLRAYARGKGYLKSKKTRKLYKKLKDYVVQKYQDSEDESWIFDATYYAIFADNNLPKKGYDAEKFCKAVMGAVFLSLEKKWKIANENLPILKSHEIEKILDSSDKELENLKKQIGKDVATELKKDFENNVLSDLYDISYWRVKVKELGKTGHYLGLLSVMDKLKIYDDYISIVDKMLTNYQNSTNKTIQKQCLDAEANIVEMYMLKGDNKKAIHHAKGVFARVDFKDQESAIMPFLLWLLDDEDTTLESVYGAIEALDKDIEFTWGFSEIESMLGSYDIEKQKMARCFIEYFENHHDKALLREMLYGKSRKSCFS